MENNKTIDEYLENLWYMKENGKDSLNDLQESLKSEYDKNIVRTMAMESLVDIDEGNGKMGLTEKGENQARSIVRAHRLAERLLYDAMGRNIEDGACEFEHIVTHELVDSICIMLGHPRECPHGLAIPEGECCRHSVKTFESSVIHLNELEVGESAKIAYINCANDHHLHRLNGLQIRPGAAIRLHQKYPTFVVECENSSIAIDDDIAHNICVWSGGRYCRIDHDESHRNKRGFMSRVFGMK